MRPTLVRMMFALALIATAQSAPAQSAASVCNEPEYVALRAIPLDSLSEREWEIYRIHHEACLAERAKLASPAAAERPFDGRRIRSHREGFWANVSLSSGRGNTDCMRCGGYGRTEPRAGFTDGVGFSIAAGGTPRDNLLVGAQIGGWAPMDDRDLAVVSILLVGQYYPFRTRGVHVTGGFGIGGIEFDEGDVNIHTEGTAIELGIGWDLPMGRSGAITPFASLLVITGGNNIEVTNADPVEGPINPRVLSVGMKLALY